MMVRYIILILGCTWCFLSCKREDDNPAPETPVIEVNSGVYVLNEGGFGFGNASISFINTDTREVTNDIFQRKNNRPLGDVLQSARMIDDQIYLVLNFSNSIEVVSAETFALQTSITGFTSPRYLVETSSSKAYVSDLYDNAVSIVDLNNDAKLGEIRLQGWTEEMEHVGDRVFVTSRESDQLYVLDRRFDILLDSITIGYNSSAVVQDKNSKLWVFCSGQEPDEYGGIFQVDPQDLTLLKSLRFSDFNIGGWPRLEINSTGDTLFYLKEDLFRLGIEENNLPTAAHISADGRILYGLGIAPESSDIFLADAIDYQQKGKVYQYNADAVLKEVYEVGVIPNGFLFY